MRSENVFAILKSDVSRDAVCRRMGKTDREEQLEGQGEKGDLEKVECRMRRRRSDLRDLWISCE